MPRTLHVTSRADLKEGSGANTKFWLDPSVYTRQRKPNPATVQAIISLEIGYIRERWWPGDPGQHAAFTSLTRGGVGLFLYIGDMTYTPQHVAADVAALANSHFAPHVVAVCGPNEANAAQDNRWPAKAVALQKAIYTEVHKHAHFARHVGIVGPALMHNNVKSLDHDYHALRAAGIIRWCDAGDFHFYPGNAGPILNASEAKRARRAFGRLPLWHSETGWTGSDTNPALAGRFSVEALLRNHLTGIVGTLLYEFADESQNVPGREGLFGLRTPTRPKPAYAEIHTLLATRDGKEPIDAWLGDHRPGVRCDAGAVVTSEGGGRWTVYLLRHSQGSATIFLKTGPKSSKRYSVALRNSMTVVHIRN
jgi:hypothetical protein